MQDIPSMLAQLRRPRLLTEAARIAAADYRREPHLGQVLGLTVLPRHGAALIRLIEREAELDRMRRDRSAAYSPARHVKVLAALLGETELLRAASLAA